MSEEFETEPLGIIGILKIIGFIGIAFVVVILGVRYCGDDSTSTKKDWEPQILSAQGAVSYVRNDLNLTCSDCLDSGECLGGYNGCRERLGCDLPCACGTGGSWSAEYNNKKGWWEVACVHRLTYYTVVMCYRLEDTPTGIHLIPFDDSYCKQWVNY